MNDKLMLVVAREWAKEQIDRRYKNDMGFDFWMQQTYPDVPIEDYNEIFEYLRTKIEVFIVTKKKES